MIWIGVFIGLISGALLVGMIWKLKKGKQAETKNWVEKDKVDINIQDIIRLAALSTTQDVSSLIIEYKINIKMPEFYEKYQRLNKREKELYFDELIAIFSKNRREYVLKLYDQYGLSTQDVLLLLMSEMQLDNKTMARIMGLSSDTFKKRKTRLRAKMQIGGTSIKEVTNA